MMIKYFNGIADEALLNNSICVKEGNRIRNILNVEDVEKELLVFVK